MHLASPHVILQPFVDVGTFDMLRHGSRMMRIRPLPWA